MEKKKKTYKILLITLCAFVRVMGSAVADKRRSFLQLNTARRPMVASSQRGAKARTTATAAAEKTGFTRYTHTHTHACPRASRKPT